MAKDNREILRGVRHNGQVFKSGQEDELQAAMSPAQLKRLQDTGSIEGDWGIPETVEDDDNADPSTAQKKALKKGKDDAPPTDPPTE